MAEAERRFPEPRRGLLVSEFAGDYVVVDPRSGRAHSLSGDAAAVWRSVQGGGSSHLSPARVDEVVAELVGLGLLEGGGVSRRSLLKAGAKGGAALALVGVTSVALPPAAAMASTVNTLQFDVGDSPATVMVPAGVTVTFTLVGGGGGSSAADFIGPGGYGGDGASLTGTLVNHASSPQTLTVVIGGGGGAGGAGGAGGSSAGAPANQGFGGGAGSGGELGGGGGASAILNGANGDVLVVAGGGGGGGTYVTGSNAGVSNASSTGGGGAGGAFKSNAEPANGGNSYWQSADDWTIMASGSDALNTGGQNADGGSDGHAQFSGHGITT